MASTSKIYGFYGCLLLFFSCGDAKDSPKIATSDSPVVVSEVPELFEDNHSTFQKWVNYYVSLDSGFYQNTFKLESTTNLNLESGNIFGTFDKEFNSIYAPFLVYSPNKEQYVDFDSYHWSLEGKTPQFEIDQEINLVNVKNKTIKRIGFRGSNELVEDAYWKNDSTVVLLENMNSTTPRISLINLTAQTSFIYTSSCTLNPKSEYSSIRIQNKLTN